MKKFLSTLTALLFSMLLTACSSDSGSINENSLYNETFGTLDKPALEFSGEFFDLVTETGENSGVVTENADIPLQTEAEGIDANTENTLVYTNLACAGVQEYIKQILISSGIPENRAEKMFQWVNDYNECMGGCENFELKDEFTAVSVPAVDYGDYYPMSTLWFKTNKRDYGDILCRLAAFELMADGITAKNAVDESRYECYSDTQWLYSDYDAIYNNPLVDFRDSEIEKYFTLYAPIEIKKGSTEQEMYDSISEEWAKRGIAFDSNIKCSLITIWLQSDELTAAGHAAVLAEYEDELLLFEKTNPQSPYQVTKFSDLEQVKRYMYESIHQDYAKYGLETGTYIVMCNEKLL